VKYDPQVIAMTPATVSENISRGLFLEIVQRQDWRCYIASDTSDFEEMCSRFMNQDARVPSIVEGENLALVPLNVIRFTTPTGTVFEGWLYLNGAVVVTKAGKDEETFLFIDSELARSTGTYPEEFFDYRVEQGEPQG
jgi:hypothetical protein